MKLTAKESLERPPTRKSDILAPNSLEVESLESEVRLHDARGFDSRPQYVLRRRFVVHLAYPFEGVEEAETQA